MTAGFIPPEMTHCRSYVTTVGLQGSPPITLQAMSCLSSEKSVNSISIAPPGVGTEKYGSTSGNKEMMVGRHCVCVCARVRVCVCVCVLSCACMG